MDALDVLTGRNSSPKLSDPAPQGAALERIMQAALRAPDHARLRPWRFLLIEGDARHKLGELYATAATARDHKADDAIEKARGHPLRAPLVIVVVACITQHPKVPRDEQLLSAGCAAHAMLLAAEAQGFAGIWRTGVHATDKLVMRGLGLSEAEEIVGYLYVGSREGPPKPLPALSSNDYFTSWP